MCQLGLLSKWKIIYVETSSLIGLHIDLTYNSTAGNFLISHSVDRDVHHLE